MDNPLDFELATGLHSTAIMRPSHYGNVLRITFCLSVQNELVFQIKNSEKLLI